MPQPKFRRIFASIALLAALSVLPAQAAGGPAQVHQRLGFSARVERLGSMAWSFLAGLFAKDRRAFDPNGLFSSITGDDGNNGH